MSFSYKTRSREYIDVTQVTDSDRIIVTLDDNRVVALRLKDKWGSCGKLEIDKKHTDVTILDTLYDGIVSDEKYQASHNRTWYWRILNTLHCLPAAHKLPSYESIRANATLEVSVRDDGDAFDDSPRVGERLCVMARMPERGGAGHFLQPSVRSVEFVTI